MTKLVFAVALILGGSVSSALQAGAPSYVLHAAVEKPTCNSSVHRPVAPVTPELGITGRVVHRWGFKIASIKHGTLADRMLLETGDVILSVNGRRIECLHDLKSTLRIAARHGGWVTLKIDNVAARRGECVHRIVKVRGRLSCDADHHHNRPALAEL